MNQGTNNNDQRNVNAASSAGGAATAGGTSEVPSQISVNDGSVASTQGRAGDAFAPGRRGGNSRA